MGAMVLRFALAPLACLSVLCLAEPAAAQGDPNPPPQFTNFATTKNPVLVPDTYSIQVDVDRSLTNSGYEMVLINDDTGAVINRTSSGTGLWTNQSAGWADNETAGPRRYHAEVRTITFGNAVSSTDQLTVTVQPAVFKFKTLATTQNPVLIPDTYSIQVEIDRSVNGSGYEMVLINADTGEVISRTTSGAGLWVNQSAGWADNKTAGPRRYNAEVRHIATGKVVSRAKELTVDVNQKFFSVKLAPTGGPPWTATATVSPSVTGTGHLIKIRRSGDGEQIASCSTGTSCSATVELGTYYATVEDTPEFVAGRSAEWVIDADGAREAMGDDLDLVALAGAFASGEAICERLLLISQGGETDNTSFPVAYSACKRALVDGLSKVDILRAIIGAAAGSTALWYLLEKADAPATEDPDGDPPPAAPPLLSWSTTQEADVDQMLAKNPKVLRGFPEAERRAKVRTIVKSCQSKLANAGRSPSECLSLPIFVSGDHSSVAEPTDHDRDALNPYYVDPYGKRGNPPWVYLTYDNSKPDSQRSWKNGFPACEGSTTGLQCDEYPFFSTEQGGPPPSGAVRPSLRKLNGRQNGVQGAFPGSVLQKLWVERQHWPAVSQRSGPDGV